MANQKENLKEEQIKKIEIFFLFFIGLIPFMWLRQEYIIAKGDYFPFWLNTQETLSKDIYLWSFDNMGHIQSLSAYIIYESLWLLLRYVGVSVGTTQILFQVFFFMGSGLSMYYLSRTIYPELDICHIVSSIFYMFNFFVLQTRLNIGFAWTYTFFPLLIALLIKIVEATYQQDNRTTNKNIIYFAITSTVVFSFASINPLNVIITLLILVVIILYYLLIQRKRIHSLFLNIMRVATISILINLWWITPILNYYLWSPSALNPQVDVTAWSWTHGRASFLNLFWLNGFWGWRPEYFPYYDSYSNPILITLTFVPLLLAAAALLFKTNKSRFNTYLMLTILTFLFLAKGLHEPLSQLNLLLYIYIPGMNMFREPTSKFTMALLPFLALLIGYAVHHIANIKIGKHKPTNIAKTLVATFFILTFIISTYRLITNPIETKTTQLPFSSYIKIPDYWYEATDWLNNQPGDYKILITPPDDFYQMPYIWGYYGREFQTRLIRKPILSNSYRFSYKINPDVTVTLQQLSNSIKYNRTAEFKAFLDLLNIKYIVQRNDIQHNFTGRNIIPPNEMQTFLTQQPYIHLAKKFGQLDIYEYTEPKHYIYTLNPATSQQATIKIENITTLEHSWNFTHSQEIEEWQNTTLQSQFGANETLTLDNGTLKAKLWNSTWGWKTINSPLLPAQYEDTYNIKLDVKGQNAHKVHVKTLELNADKEFLTGQYSRFIGDGTFNWTHITFNFKPTKQTTKYIQIQIWHGHETNKPFPNTVWIDNVQIHGYTTILNTMGLDLMFPHTTQNQQATILRYTKVNPTKITATINATRPFILAVSEALDISWTAYVNGTQYKPIPLYLGLKGFNITQTGLLRITIEYEPQEWFLYASFISLFTAIGCITYLTYSYTKDESAWKRIKTLLNLRNPRRLETKTQQ